MANLKELMAKQSPESQKRIAEKVEEMRQTIALSRLREELNLSQAELAAALGGEISIDVTLPTGKQLLKR